VIVRSNGLMLPTLELEAFRLSCGLPLSWCRSPAAYGRSRAEPVQVPREQGDLTDIGRASKPGRKPGIRLLPGTLVSGRWCPGMVSGNGVRGLASERAAADGLVTLARTGGADS
jgi:hypothetical protein